MENIAMLLSGAIEARAKVGLKMNVPEDKLAEVVGFLPAEKSPTVSRLADTGVGGGRGDPGRASRSAS